MDIRTSQFQHQSLSPVSPALAKPETPSSDAFLTEILPPQEKARLEAVQGSSLVEVALVGVSANEFSQSEPLQLKDAELEKVLQVYHAQMKAALQTAPEGSTLHKFATALRLQSMLQDARLAQDPQAADILTMRKTQVAEQYQTLVQTPEVKALFDLARTTSLQQIFGSHLAIRAQQQASFLLSAEFQASLAGLAPEAIQAKVQKELSALALLNPPMAEALAPQLLEKTMRSQALHRLQSQGEEGVAARESLANALNIYLKAQQTATSVGLQASNLARLSQLSDEKLEALTQAVAGLSAGSGATNYQKLAQNLLDKVDELPSEMRTDASALISHLQTQNVLGTVIFVGALAGLLQQDLPSDPKAWVSLTSSSIGTAAMSASAFRLVGLENMADFVNKINFKAGLGGLQIPVVSSVLAGVNTTLAAINLVDEVKNEDLIGTASQAIGVGTGLASIAAITVLSGPAAPITLIGASVVGLAAWGLDSLWGESDLSGKIRQDLRALGITDAEQAILEKYTSESLEQPLEGLQALELQKSLAQASPAEKLALINQAMDKYTSKKDQTLIFYALNQNNDQDLLLLLGQLNTARLASELESAELFKPFLFRIANLEAPLPTLLPVLEPILVRLAEDGRSEELADFMVRVKPEIKASISAGGLNAILQALNSRWFGQAAYHKLGFELLSAPELQTQLKTLYQAGGEAWLQPLVANFDAPQAALIKTQLAGS